MEKVGNCLSTPTQAGRKDGRCPLFKEGEKVERDVNGVGSGGIGLDAQDKKEEESEGGVISKEEEGRGKGSSVKDREAGGNI